MIALQAALPPLTGLRQALGRHGELSGQEVETRRLLREFLTRHTSLEVYDLAGGLVAAHREAQGPCIAFRGDMDAIPGPNGPYHGCGHDGHSALLAGLGLLLEGRRLGKSVLLLFQPGEETGQGAASMVQPLLARERVAAVVGFHNIPGYPLGQPLLRQGVFACASQGLLLHLQGKQAHAAYPEEGSNPIPLLAGLLEALPALCRQVKASGLLLYTPVGFQAGGFNFGVSPGEGSLALTLRADRQQDIKALIQAMAAWLKARLPQGMSLSMEDRDVFPDTTNHAPLVEAAAAILEQAGLAPRFLEAPMRWSEDFGHFLRAIPGFYMGLGAGEAQPGLHTPGYVFNDGLLSSGLSVLWALAQGLTPPSPA